MVDRQRAAGRDADSMDGFASDGLTRRHVSMKDLQSADIIVTTCRGDIRSRIIRMATRSPVSHVMLFDSGGLVIESVFDGGVRLVPLAQALCGSSLAVVYRYRGLTRHKARMVTLFARNQVSRGYNTWGLLRVDGVDLGWEPVTAIARKGTALARMLIPRRYFYGKMYCSQLVLNAFARTGISLVPGAPGRSCPNDIPRAAVKLHRLDYIGHLRG
jgi:hypothetical protein